MASGRQGPTVTLAAAHGVPPPAFMRTIEAAALTLEPQTADHADEMFAVLSDPAIYRHENQPPPSAEWLRARFGRLESRASPDGAQLWLNWVIRLPSARLVGYVQAAVHPSHCATIAYVLASQSWGRGLATAAVQAMVAELVATYGVTQLSAVLKRSNLRSLRLLERLGFAPASGQQHELPDVAADELLMLREAVASR